MIRVGAWSALLLTLGVPGRAAAPDPAQYQRSVRPFFEKFCFDCHDSSTQKGGLNLEALPTSFTGRSEQTVWTTIFDRMERGEMPPPKKPRPPAQLAKPAMQWIGLSIYDAQMRKQAALGRAAWKRLNRAEYQNTIRDLLFIDQDVQSLLPDEALSSGFDNVDLALDVSAIHLEKFLEAADAALDAALVKGPRPVPVTKRASLLDEKGAVANAMGKNILALPDAAVLLNESYPPKVFGAIRVSKPGLYKIRLSASAWHSKETLPLLAYTGNFYGGGSRSELLGVFDASPDKPQVHEAFAHLVSNETVRIIPRGPSKEPNKQTVEEYTGPGLAVQWAEIEGPLAPEWPPASVTHLLGEVDLAKGTLADAETILKKFLPRAFRRPLAMGEEKPYVELVKAKLAGGESFEQALRLGLKAVLVSPDFLYLQAAPGRLDDFALASRLSYFLWSTMPDEALLAVARSGRLHEPATLRAQVERMLADAKAAAFTENFTGLWLKLREIRATMPDKKLFPEFDDLLEWSMVRETHAFFQEVLTHNLSLLNFVQSDFAMLNDRLAELYGIPGVDGTTFRKVALRPEWHRGGVLTQAAVLKVTANGTNTSPVPRGVFFLDRILGRPVLPPPKNTPAIEPDTRGATTIRAQLEKHRNVELCATCHNRIDPPGAALESYDVIGGWRENYRVLGLPFNQRSLDPRDGKNRFQYGPGPKCQTDGAFSEGRKFENIDDFRKVLLADPASREQIARCLAEKLLIYATGHSLEFADRAAVTQIVNAVAPQNFGFRSLVHEVVQSPAFLKK